MFSLLRSPWILGGMGASMGISILQTFASVVHVGRKVRISFLGCYSSFVYRCRLMARLPLLSSHGPG